MRTPTELSPYNYFQERYRHDEWKLLVVVMMLNQTSGKQVEGVDIEFFRRWPDPESLLSAKEEEIKDVIRRLGFYNRRARMLIEMSKAYLRGGWQDASDLPGCGKYASDSWRIFIKGELVSDVDDKELKKYVAWAKEIS